jgi:hypothetical protein
MAPSSGKFGASGAIQVLARSAISPKQQVLVLQVGQRLIVVGDSGQQLSALCQIMDLDESAALIAQIQRERDQPAGNTFAALLGRAGEKFKAADEPAATAGVTHSASLNEADLGLATTREELDGLMEKVRDIKQTLKRR